MVSASPGEEKRKLGRTLFVAWPDTGRIKVNLHILILGDKRGRHKPKHALSDEDKEFLLEHIRNLPKQECQSSNTKRQYLLGYNSIRDVFQSYERACKEAEPPVRFVKEKAFNKIFCKSFNLGFMKEECRKATLKSKSIASADDSLHMATMVELQSVLQLPHSNALSF